MGVKPFYIVSYTSDHMSLPLHDVNDNKSGPKVTVVIGPNGSGKSTAIASLVDELEMMHVLLKSPEEQPKHFRFPKSGTIEFRCGGSTYSLERQGTTLTAYMNNEPVNLEDVPFPSSALAVAHLPTDKFRYSRNDDNSFYRYLGLRQATNMVTTGALEAKVISSLLNGLQSDGYRQAIGEWLKVLNISGSFEIELRNMTIEAFSADGFADLDRIARRTQFRSMADYISFLQDRGGRPILEADIGLFFGRLGALCETAETVNPGIKRRRRTFTLPVEALRDETDETGISWEQGMEIIRKLRLADEVRLIVNKNGQRTAFSDLSSGERCIIGTVTRLFEYAAEGCVITIDEPEVSLHPSWQIRYIPTLLKALRHLKSAHVLIATHSHFLVSDVDASASLVVAETDQAGHWKFSAFEGEVYGRTPENILYRVFGVGAATNFYVERDLSDALQMLSNSANIDRPKLQQIRHRLSNVVADDNPAFLEILTTIDKVLGGD